MIGLEDHCLFEGGDGLGRSTASAEHFAQTEMRIDQPRVKSDRRAIRFRGLLVPTSFVLGQSQIQTHQRMGIRYHHCATERANRQLVAACLPSDLPEQIERRDVPREMIEDLRAVRFSRDVVATINAPGGLVECRVRIERSGGRSGTPNA